MEFASGLLWLTAGVLWGISLRTAFGILFFYLLLILTAIDIDTMRLPNRLVGILAIVGVTGVVLSEILRVPILPLIGLISGIAQSSAVQAAVGALVSGGVAWALAVGYRFLRRLEGFGMGDVKLLVVLGVFLGPYALLAMFIGSVFGATYGVVATSVHRLEWNARYPFGPFLALGAVLTCVFGIPLLSWYVGIIT